jgi:hypothetical protein
MPIEIQLAVLFALIGRGETGMSLVISLSATD